MQLVNHEVTKMTFRNNKDFYDDVFNKKFDIRLFRPHIKTAENIVAFLAFGEDAIKLLQRWVPNYRARFWWYVVRRHVFQLKSFKR